MYCDTYLNGRLHQLLVLLQIDCECMRAVYRRCALVPLYLEIHDAVLIVRRNEESVSKLELGSEIFMSAVRIWRSKPFHAIIPDIPRAWLCNRCKYCRVPRLLRRFRRWTYRSWLFLWLLAIFFRTLSWIHRAHRRQQRFRLRRLGSKRSSAATGKEVSSEKQRKE